MNRIKKLRKEKGYSLNEVAEHIGVTPMTISRYENGKREPKLKIWKKLADFFNVSVPYLQGVSNLELTKPSSVSNILFDLIKKKVNPKNKDDMEKLKNIIDNASLANTLSFQTFYDHVLNKGTQNSDSYLKDSKFIEKTLNIKDLSMFINFLFITIGLSNQNEEEFYKFIHDLDYSKNEYAISDLLVLLDNLFHLGIEAITSNASNEDSNQSVKTYLQVVRILSDYFYTPDPNDEEYTKEEAYKYYKDNLFNNNSEK